MKQQILSFWRRTASTLTKDTGDISSVFPSLSGKAPDPLPARFSDLKKRLIRGNEDAVKTSWLRLLISLREEIEEIKKNNNAVSCLSPIFWPSLIPLGYPKRQI